jgi:pyridoxamine 5'-phosphate oxidase-like protein
VRRTIATKGPFMPLQLTQEIKDLVNNGLVSGNPMVLAVVTALNRPRLSFRGSTQAYSDDALCFWLRNTSGETIDAIRHNPSVAMMYRSASVPLLQFQGRARIAADEVERARVYESAPERERASDPERKGIAVVIDLDRVEGVLGRDENGPRFFRADR